MRKWRLAGQDEFDSITSLKKQLKHDFDDILHDVAEDAIQMGYIEPGHGIKGRQGNTGLQMMIFMICTKLTGRTRSCFGYTPE